MLKKLFSLIYLQVDQPIKSKFGIETDWMLISLIIPKNKPSRAWEQFQIDGKSQVMLL